MYTFEKKVVWITGSTTGIGKMTAIGFAERGADVIIHGFNDTENGEKLLKHLKELGSDALLVDGDVSLKKDVENIAKQIQDKYGKLDVLVNNVGASITSSTLEELEEDVWDKVIDVNLKSVYLVTKEALPLLKGEENTRIINISSAVERTGGTMKDLAYTAAKGGVSAITRALAKQLIDFNIQVNAVAPGLIDTPFHKTDAPLDSYDWIINRIPMKKAGQAEDIAGAVMFLASNHANYINGEIIEVSGGRRVS
ncbi:SDR family NAD(P)-dependent oxidoreductase [Psychrobacillus soli]|uniref:SDR family oxidoreductase n=1 Tax=Psychrobacillus soli TaxID=1543965 RepID=A0A544SWS3_9BACI|nr:SDR family NAD(P)-dependent oxidoreductase [Psychrobacillus soli]TQR09648.1 SDR family oxidoreductase [Psychrobacillus soli]